MLLGNNYGNEGELDRWYRRKGESPDCPYWRNLRCVLDGCGISLEQCFATNAYPGLLTGPSNLGCFPGADDMQFQAVCREFLTEQIRVVRSVLIVTLGLYVPPFLSALSPDLSGWRNVSKLKHLNGDNALVRRAAFEGTAHVAAVVALTHPSYRQRNARYRQYHGFTGDDAERRMLKDAANAAGF